ncbi:MAG: T9SS type A sorting domain-containing protein, partial [Ignavibacteriaceae bacterium]|nr:T9SS type A sorting domain-containing protein [Ignavibacteriaceae bacterium]
IKPVFSTNINMPVKAAELTSLQNSKDVTFALVNNNDLHLLNDNGNITTNLNNFSDVHPAAFFWNNTNYFVGAKASLLNVYMADGAVNYQSGVTFNENITTSPVVRLLVTEEREILFGTDKGRIYFYSTGRLPAIDPTQTKQPVVIDTNLVIKKIAVDGLYYCGIALPATLSSTRYFDSDNNTYQIENETAIDLALTKNKNGKYVSIILTNGNNFYLLSEGKLIAKFAAENNVTSFSVGDVKQDGENYIVYNAGNKVYAVNLTGATADNFPFADPNGFSFVSTPLVVDFEGDNKAEIIASTEDGRVFAIFGGTGKTVPGFPISLGENLAAVPVTFVKDKQISFAALNNIGSFSGYKIGAAEGTVFWGGKNGGSSNLSFVPAASVQSYVNEFFPKNRAYNYPNPVYDSETYIRYYVNENSKINIKIFDLAGDFVSELNNDATGGMDNETKWDVSNIQSGVYFARIEAAGVNGKTETNIIKIAVVK